MNGRSLVSRRSVIFGGAAGLAVGAAGTEIGNLLAPGTPAPSKVPPPGETLMNEHGVLKRLLLVYQDATDRLTTAPDVAIPAIHSAAELIHDFIENFHEALEEGYVFPTLKAANQLVPTVDTLLLQHARGRLITQLLLSEATPAKLSSTATQEQVSTAVAAFVRMYQPHEAREDTVVFPAFRSICSPRQLEDYGQTFLDLQAKQFGTQAFDTVVGQVAKIEQALGIYDLSQFTPPAIQPVP